MVQLSFIERVLALIQEKGTTKNKLLMELGLGKNSFVDWTEKGNLPNGATIIKIADYFGVTTDYLLKGEVSQTRLESTEEIKMNEKVWESLKDFFMEISTTEIIINNASGLMHDLGINGESFDEWIVFNFDNTIPDEDQLKKLAYSATSLAGEDFKRRFKFNQLANICIHHMRQSNENQQLNNIEVKDVAN